jgi:CRP-like cAMP-binding protein
MESSMTDPPLKEPSDPILRRLPLPLRRLVAEPEYLAEFEPGAVILPKGAGKREIQFVVSGEVGLALSEPKGEKIAVDVLGPGDIFGEISFFTGIPWPSDAELIAHEPTRVLRIPVDIFESALRQDGDFAVSLVKNLVRKIMLLDRTILKAKLARRELHTQIVGDADPLKSYAPGNYLKRRLGPAIEEAAKSNRPVLIIGEDGVGKEAIARLICLKSHVCKDVCVCLDSTEPGEDTANCRSHDLDRDSSEAQLCMFFGSEEAGEEGVTRKIGRFERAEDGTLIARGIDRLCPQTQLKLLEAVVTETFRPCGGARLRKARVRVVALTQVPAAQITLERHPFMFALLRDSITVPPLRTRRREIPALARRYLEMHNRELGAEVSLTREALRSLLQYQWPGNDAELSSVIRSCVLNAE